MSKVMGQKWLAGVVTAGFIVVTPSVVWSQIAGRVQNGSGAALSGATVEVWDSYPSGSILGSDVSDAQGTFSIGAVAGSTVDLRVRKSNSYPTVVRDLPQPTSNTTVRLTAAPIMNGNPNSCDYWDDATTFLAEPLGFGDVVECIALNGQTCGVGSIINDPGIYLLHAFGDDPGIAGVDGPVAGENLTFKINGLAATSSQTIFVGGGFSCSTEKNIVGATSVSGITLTGPTDATGSAGNSAFIVYGITNSGNVAGNFTLNVELTPGWTVNLSSQKGLLPFNLNAGETATIVAEIVIPGGTGDQDVEVRARISSDTYGQANSGAWTTLAVSTTSDVGGDNGGLLPTSFSLAQNYPNPFNAGTNITFNLDQSGQVSLTVCNLLGQSVRTLIDGHREVGIQTEVWDGRDDNGNTVPSGIYFSRLVQNDQRQVRKMVLLK